MQFQVPQFIEVEDRIFGPLTFKQFIYVAGGAGAAYLLWRMLPLWVAGPLIIAVGGFAAALAFAQWNGRPFILSLESGFYYLVRTKLYLWDNEKKQKNADKKKEKDVPTSESNVHIPKLSDSRLHELSWSLDIKERIAAGIAREDDRRGGVIASIRTAQEARI